MHSDTMQIRTQGWIEELLYNPHDDVDGWKLRDGTLVHFPPHVGEQLCEWIGKGDRVVIEGHRRTNRNEEQIVFPNYVESQGWSLSFDQKKPPRRENHSHDRDHDEHDGAQVSNAQILNELREIRRLIEKLT